MGKTEYYSPSQSSYDDATSRATAILTSSSAVLSSESVNDTSLCKCQQTFSGATNCSSSARRRINSNTIRIPVTSPIFLITIMLFFISYFTCCVSAWPILNQRRTYNFDPALLEDAYIELPSINQWALAEQPNPVYDTLQTFPLQQQPLYQDEYENPIYDQVFDEDALANFGPIMDAEPEEELELEELKHEQPYMYEKRRSEKGTATVKPPVIPASQSPSSHPQTTPASTESSPSISSKVVPLTVSPKRTTINNGQKEIAMLRPPSSKSHHIQLDKPEEPKISVAQRSPSNEKPSAYDRLRKYLSLDDALKKEYQQRRSNAMSRHHSKRASTSSIITDSDNLTGQLNNLKKKID